MDSIRQDVRYAARMLLQNPGFTIVAVLVLALGIGANTSIFAITNALLLKPIVAEDPEELVALYSRDRSRPDTYRAFSYPNYRDIRELNDTFTDLLAHDLSVVGVTRGERTDRVFAELVSHDYFDTFGVEPYRGRFFTPEEEVPDGGALVAVVSYEHWRRTGEDPDLVGTTLTVNGMPLEIVGIAPRDFTGRTAMMSPEIYAPLGLYDRLLHSGFDSAGRPLDEREHHTLMLVGRLRPDLTIEEANARLDSLASRLEEQYPAINEDQTILVRPLARLSVSTSPDDESELAMVAVLMLGMTGIVLLLAAINLANMLLARGASRRKEFAVRAALGGGRARILRQLLTEGALLAILGGIVSLLVASWVSRLLADSINDLMALSGMRMDILLRGGPDLRVLLATAVFCMIGTLLFALGPALRQSRPDVMEDLKEHGGDGPSVAGRRSLFAGSNLLVIGQIGLSLVLLVAAGLFVRASLEAANVEPGFDIEHGLLTEVDPSLIGYEDERGRDLFRRLKERLAGIPGIRSVSVASTVPFGNVSTGRGVRRAGDLPPPGETRVETVSATSTIVGADYFETMGIDLVRGRGFDRNETEADNAPPTVVIDQRLARLLWPERDPIGRRIAFGAEPGDNDIEHEVVGVVATVKDDLFATTDRPHVYTPFGRNYQSAMTVHLRAATTDPAVQGELLSAIRREIRGVDSRLPILTLRTLRDHIDSSASLWVTGLAATIFSTFGAVALFLSVVGVYGVKAWTVARRTREIGLRKALGATSRGTLWLVVREGMVLTGVGLGLGLLLSAATARLLSSLLYEVSALDPMTFVGAPLVLAAAALVATYLPALRAARVAPVIALKQN